MELETIKRNLHNNEYTGTNKIRKGKESSTKQNQQENKECKK
jgi:hypothetical protein